MADFAVILFFAFAFTLSLIWLAGYALEMRDGDPQDWLDHTMAGAHVYLVVVALWLVVGR